MPGGMVLIDSAMLELKIFPLKSDRFHKLTRNDFNSYYSELLVISSGGLEGDQVLPSSLEGWNREYDDGNFAVDSLVQVKRTGTQETKWMDVILMEKNKPDKNVSLCDGRNCTQPSMSNDRKRIVYIKEDE